MDDEDGEAKRPKRTLMEEAQMRKERVTSERLADIREHLAAKEPDLFLRRPKQIKREWKYISQRTNANE